MALFGRQPGDTIWTVRVVDPNSTTWSMRVRRLAGRWLPQGAPSDGHLPVPLADCTRRAGDTPHRALRRVRRRRSGRGNRSFRPYRARICRDASGRPRLAGNALPLGQHLGRGSLWHGGGFGGWHGGGFGGWHGGG